jgi:hypothetical protein
LVHPMAFPFLKVKVLSLSSSSNGIKDSNSQTAKS